MRSRVLHLSAALTLTAALSACGTPPSPSAPPLEGTSWTLVALGGQTLPTFEPARAPSLMLQAADKRLSGFTGCNRLMGSYMLQGTSLRFGQTATTRMACLGGPDVEGPYLKALEGVAAWRAVGDRLQLLDAGQQVVAEFAAAAPASR